MLVGRNFNLRRLPHTGRLVPFSLEGGLPAAAAAVVYQYVQFVGLQDGPADDKHKRVRSLSKSLRALVMALSLGYNSIPGIPVQQQ